VKRTFLLVAGIAALAAVAYGCTSLLAQAGGQAAPPATKLGVVNVGTVFTKYEKAKLFKDQLQTTIKPFKDKADAWRGEMIKYQDLITKQDFKQYKKEDLDKAILDRKRALEDMDREVRNLIGKQQEDQLVQLWKEVTTHIKLYGKTRGFQVVLGFGDPMEAKEMDTFANINRKMQGMDLGAACPLYVADGLDVSEDLVVSLNAAYHQNQKGLITPTGASNK
jgi:Skp family chaperone for outer membrane proteins